MSKKFNLFKCYCCKEYINVLKKRKDGLPAMMGFVLESGETINMCADCIIKVGRMDEQEKDKFFKEIKDKYEI